MTIVINKGRQDMIVPIVDGGLVAMKLLGRLKKGRIDHLPGIIYLDRAHEKEETYLELIQAWDLLRDCNAIIGANWNWPAVWEMHEDLLRMSIFPVWLFTQ